MAMMVMMMVMVMLILGNGIDDDNDGHDDHSFLRQSTCAGRGCFAETSTGCGLSLITE